MSPHEAAEQLEAEARRLMAKHAATPARGWSTQRERDVLHRRIDGLLDDRAELMVTARLETLLDAS